MGRAEMSYNLLSDTLRQAERHPSFSLSYNYLWILELAVFYAEHGFPPLPGIDLDTLFREAEISPSPMMRGHALRLKAILLRKKSPQDALDLLDKSLEILKDANMPIEYGFTERRRSELLNTLGAKPKPRPPRKPPSCSSAVSGWAGNVPRGLLRSRKKRPSMSAAAKSARSMNGKLLKNIATSSRPACVRSSAPNAQPFSVWTVKPCSAAAPVTSPALKSPPGCSCRAAI